MARISDGPAYGGVPMRHQNGSNLASAFMEEVWQHFSPVWENIPNQSSAGIGLIRTEEGTCLGIKGGKNVVKFINMELINAFFCQFWKF